MCQFKASSSVNALQNIKIKRKIKKAKLGEPDTRQTFPPNPKSEELLTSFAPPPHPHRRRRDSLVMDLDLDLDASWSFDQILSAASNAAASPFLLSTSELPCSPLWAFSDDNNNEDTAAGNSTSVEFRLSDYSSVLSCNTDLITENASFCNDKSKTDSSILQSIPLDYPDGSCIVKERMTQALRYFRDSTEQNVLVQAWAPVKNGGRYVLTTSGQPFVLDPKCNVLHQYRMVSLMYLFSVDEGTDGDLGLPGRVFRQKLPEWTPSVQHYSSKQFSRLNHALHYNVQGTFALPVFEPSGQSCVGVLELIMTTQKINYAPEVDKLCKALEAVNLKSSKILDRQNIQGFSRFDVSLGLQEGEEFSVQISSTVDDDNFKLFNICRSGGNLNGHDGIKVANVRKKQHTCSIAEASREVYTNAVARITLDILRPHFGGNLVDAAESLGVSRSTLKRICRRLGIERWPSHKRKKVDHHIQYSSDATTLPAGAVELVEEQVIQESHGGNPGVINASLEKEAATPTIPTSSGNAKSIALGGENDDKCTSIIVKATYKEKTVMFPVSCNSGIEYLSNEIAKRFKLQVESFTIEYEDEEDGDWVMIACNEDLDYHIESLKSSGQRKIKLLVVPKINGAE